MNMNEKVLKNQKGVTLLALSITIVLIIIVAGIGIYTGREVLDKIDLQTINTNMLLIQIKCKGYAEKATFSNDSTELKGVLLSSIIENQTEPIYSEVNKFITEGIISVEDEHYDKYYVLTQDNLDDMALDVISNGAYYIVNYQTEEVYYSKGFKVNDITYYKLSELQLTVDI